MADAADDPQNLFRILAEIMDQKGMGLSMMTEARLKKAGLVERSHGKVLLTRSGRERLRQLMVMARRPIGTG